MKKIYLFLLCLFLFIGCSNNDNGSISYMKAKEMIINNNAILIDVRTEDEYNERHISGAVLLTLDEINEDSASEVIDDSDSYVIVYCRSGARSRDAYTKLKELGYKNVFDLGSIDNWKE